MLADRVGRSARPGRRCQQLLAGGMLALAAAGAHGAPPADLVQLVEAYKHEDYSTARRLAGALAELGESRAQALYGDLMRQGKGGERDEARGIGWLLAAADNGAPMVPPEQVGPLRERLLTLPEPRQAEAEDILARYGREPLHQRLLPDDEDLRPCPGLTPPRLHRIDLTEAYPLTALAAQRMADVMLTVQIGADARAREPQVLVVLPNSEEFIGPAVHAVIRGRYEPARLDGQPVGATYLLKLHYRYGRLAMRDRPVPLDQSSVAQLAELAERGSPSAEFALGAAAAVDAQAVHQHPADGIALLLKAAQGGHPGAQYLLAQILYAKGTCRELVKADGWLAAAAARGEPAAQLLKARRLLGGTGDVAGDVQAQIKALLLDAARARSPAASRVAIGLLATSPLPGVRDVAEAAALAADAPVTGYERDPLTWEALAAAHAGGGDFAVAIRFEKRAIEQADGAWRNTDAMRLRLAAYERHEAWTGDLIEPR